MHPLTEKLDGEFDKNIRDSIITSWLREKAYLIVINCGTCEMCRDDVAKILGLESEAKDPVKTKVERLAEKLSAMSIIRGDAACGMTSIEKGRLVAKVAYDFFQNNPNGGVR